MSETRSSKKAAEPSADQKDIDLTEDIYINVMFIDLTNDNLYQKYVGMNRDFTKEKKELFNEMSGDIDALNDPANVFGRKNEEQSVTISV
jgi:hypothetical protein